MAVVIFLPVQWCFPLDGAPSAIVAPYAYRYNLGLLAFDSITTQRQRPMVIHTRSSDNQRALCQSVPVTITHS